MGFFKQLLGLGSEPNIQAVPPESTAAEMNNLPLPPPGFTWHSFESARMTVLRPQGWHVHQVDAENFTGCISKECIQAQGYFITGLTLHAFRGIKADLQQHNPNYHPDVPILAILELLYPNGLSDPQFQVLHLDDGVQRAPGFRLFRFRFRQIDSGRPDIPWSEPVICQKLLIEFDQSPDVYHFTFESPESSWEDSWKIGKQILTNLVFSASPSTGLIYSIEPPLPTDDVLQENALEVGRALGWSLAHENRPEGLFIWCIDLLVPRGDGSRSTYRGAFAWYMKRSGNVISLYDPLDLFPLSGISEDDMSDISIAARELQEDFKRRWLTLVGPVTFQPASIEMVEASRKAMIRVFEEQDALPRT